MSRARRIWLSVAAGFVGLILYGYVLFPYGCNDGGGMSSFERCITYLGTPAFSVQDLGWNNSLDVIPPILFGLIIGFATWWLLGRRAESGHGK
jgi:hypothetical protein